MSTPALYARLLVFARPYVVFMVLSVGCMLVQAAATSAVAYLVKPAIDEVFVKNTSGITIQDLTGWDRLLHLAQNRDPGLPAELLRAELPADQLARIARLREANRWSPELKQAVVWAFNAMKDDPGLYGRTAGRIELPGAAPLRQERDRLAARGVLAQSPDGTWRTGADLAATDREDLRWFNIRLLRQVYPRTFTKAAERDFQMLYLIPLLLIIAYGLKGVADFGQAYFMGYVGNRTVTDIREHVYRHLQTLSLSFFASNSTGVLMSRIANDVGIMRRAVSDSVKKILQSACMSVGLTAVAFYQNWRMAAVCFLLMPLVVWLVFTFGHKSRRYSRRTQERTGRLSTFLDETISGNQTMQAFCMEPQACSRFLRETERLLRVNLKSLRIGVLASPLMEICGGAMAAVIIYYGGRQIFNGTMTPGEFFSFLAAVGLLYRPVKSFSKENIKLQRGLAAAVRVFDLLDVRPEIHDAPGAAELAPFRSSVAFRNVAFRYGDTPVLHGIDFTVSAGEILALVGHSGAGKTTVANLLLRFYDVTDGQICIDGTDIRTVTQRSLRRQIAFVSQETVLFNDTVRNNIAYGSAGVSDDDIRRAARAACAEEFIEKMPAGYDTMIGEKGVRVSGGQRQRLAIARALIKNAPILILDEATSALDAQSEQLVQQALENLMSGRTTFIIAHRLATVRNADTILVLENGRIVERGSHGDLMEHCGIYSSLIEIQSAYRKNPAAADPA